MKKRLFSILLIPCIVIILMPIMAFAETKQCSSCGNQLTVIYTKIDSLYHNVVSDYCKICRVGKFSGQEAHNLEDKLYTDLKGHWKSCSVCYGQVNYEEHKWSEFKTKTPATCTEAGLEYCKCEICNRESYRTISKVEHNWKSDYTIDKEATCESDGSKSIHCSNCDAVKDRETITAAGHDLVHHKAQTATCTANGWDAYDTCNKCDYTTYRETPATGHSFGKWETVIYPSCTYNGSEKRTCTVCQAVETKDINSYGHSWESNYTIDKEATCESDGSKSIHCRYCDAVKDSETITATGHKEEVLEAKSATVFSTGLTEGKKCSVCGAVLVAQEEIPELEVGTPAFTVNAAKKVITVKASRAENATGYKIFYKKANAKRWKTWTVKGKKVLKKFAKLEKGKYRVKVRAYAKDYEGSGAVKWGKISKVKTVKIK